MRFAVKFSSLAVTASTLFLCGCVQGNAPATRVGVPAHGAALFAIRVPAGELQRDYARGAANLQGAANWRSEANTPLEALLREGDRPLGNNGLCPPDMATIDDRFCVDRFEASLVEVLPTGEERPWSPYESVEGHVVRAVSEPGVVPQGYVSGKQAAEACSRSGKRLCSAREWVSACMGPDKKRYGYSDSNEPRRCNDHGRGPVMALFGSNFDPANQHEWNWDRMNRPELNQMSNTVAPTGSHEGCTNDYGVYDMVGNLHEWVADPSGTFRGGYYQDTHINGEGCEYRTKAHGFSYHDYSTGFRCCADPAW